MNAADHAAVREWVAGQLGCDPALLTVNDVVAGGSVEVLLDASLFPPSTVRLTLVIPATVVLDVLAAWDGANA